MFGHKITFLHRICEVKVGPILQVLYHDVKEGEGTLSVTLICYSSSFNAQKCLAGVLAPSFCWTGNRDKFSDSFLEFFPG